MTGETPLLPGWLEESPAAAEIRQVREFEELVRVSGPLRIVLYGAGKLGSMVCRSLTGAGIAPLAFADNDPSLYGKAQAGVPIYPLAEAVRQFGATAVFVVTIFNGRSPGMASRLEQVRARGVARVATFLTLGAWLSHTYPKAKPILPHYAAERACVLLAHAALLRETVRLFEDPVSRQVLAAQLRWRLYADFPKSAPSAPSQYAPSDLFALSPDERVFDGGAFDGDTLRGFGTNFSVAWAVEPDPMASARLRRNVDSRVRIFACALGACAGTARFCSTGDVGSAIQADGETWIPVQTIDDILDGASPTYLKLDVEGSELAALRGAECTLRRAQPLVAVCLYHRPSDLWEIPLYLKKQLPSHRFFLRVHEEDGFELVLYAVPRERLARPDGDRCLDTPLCGPDQGHQL